MTEIENRDRRRFLSLVAGAAATTATAGIPLPVAAAGGGTMSLKMKNVNTGEKLDVVWYRDGSLDPMAVGALNVMFRDWRQDKAVFMDMKLYFILSVIHYAFGTDKMLHLTSGYRSPETNKMLAERGGAAVRSYHLLGRAADISIPGVDHAHIRDLALKMRLGGVGYYERQGFCHVDTGPVRQWYK